VWWWWWWDRWGVWWQGTGLITVWPCHFGVCPCVCVDPCEPQAKHTHTVGHIHAERTEHAHTQPHKQAAEKKVNVSYRFHVHVCCMRVVVLCYVHTHIYTHIHSRRGWGLRCVSAGLSVLWVLGRGVAAG
jgi:hypothetical protein